jgi:hypothetical protein
VALSVYRFATLSMVAKLPTLLMVPVKLVSVTDATFSSEAAPPRGAKPAAAFDEKMPLCTVTAVAPLLNNAPPAAFAELAEKEQLASEADEDDPAAKAPPLDAWLALNCKFVPVTTEPEEPKKPPPLSVAVLFTNDTPLRKAVVFTSMNTPPPVAPVLQLVNTPPSIVRLEVAPA